MDIVELKNKIVNNILTDEIHIFKYTDNKFLCYQYIDFLCSNNGKQKVFIESLNQLTDEYDIFNVRENALYILDKEKVTEYIDPNLHDVVVVCKELPKDTKVDFIEFPKLANWQIEDFVKMRLPGLDEVQQKWLCSICQYDIYRIDNECKKLELFTEQAQKIVFKQMNDENAYSDLTTRNIFHFIDALLKKDYRVLCEILSDLITIDVEGTGVVTLMLRNIKTILDIQMNPRCTAESLGVKPFQFNTAKYYKGRFTDAQLINVFEFLTNIDYRIKNGELTFEDSANHLTNNNKLVDYLAVNLLNLTV